MSLLSIPRRSSPSGRADASPGHARTARPPLPVAPDVASPAAATTVATVTVTATVTVVGPADRTVTERVADRIRALLAAGVTRLVVDVSSAVGEVDAALLTVLARTRAELADHGGTLQITGMALPQFLDVLDHAALDEVFVVYDALRRCR